VADKERVRLYVNLTSAAGRCVDALHKYGSDSDQYRQATHERDIALDDFRAYVNRRKNEEAAN
jgi:hypothetical protein